MRVPCAAWMLVVAFLMSGVAAFADGAFFSVARDMAEPNQKAVLYLDKGIETLLLQVRYDGSATDFGWVVPVPAKPKLSAGQTQLFVELSRLTRPMWQLGKKQGAKQGGTGGGGGGVTVIERAQVGPYDATVLAATDSGALARWLQQHRYALPAGAEPVLQQYLERKWYFVAMRIDTTRAAQELLARLQRLDPGIRSFQDAPEKIAAYTVKLADSDDGTHPLNISKRLAKVRALMTDIAPYLGQGGITTADFLGAVYHEYVDNKPHRVKAGLVIPAEAEAWLKCPVSETDLLAAARRVRIKVKNRSELAQVLVKKTNAELRRKVPYAKSTVGRLYTILAQSDAAACESLSDNAIAYTLRQQLLQALRTSPPLSREEIARREKEFMRQNGPWARANESRLTRNAVSGLFAVQGHSQLYTAVYEIISRAPDTVTAALHAGLIKPLKLEFASNSLVYPLLLSSLGTSTSEVQLYVLSEHRMMTEGLRTTSSYQKKFSVTYAARLIPESLRGYPELLALLSPTRVYLTELHALLTPAQMLDDLVLRSAATDTPVAGGYGPGNLPPTGSRRQWTTPDTTTRVRRR